MNNQEAVSINEKSPFHTCKGFKRPWVVPQGYFKGYGVEITGNGWTQTYWAI
jgi:hypothetical protein